MPNFAVIVQPLTALMRQDKESKKTVPFVWDDKCEAAFQKVEELLITATLLYPPDFTKNFSCGLMPTTGIWSCAGISKRGWMLSPSSLH